MTVADSVRDERDEEAALLNKGCRPNGRQRRGGGSS